VNYFISSTFLKVAGLSIATFIILDLLWLSVVGQAIYFKHLSYLAEVQNNRIVFNLPVGLAVQAIIGLALAAFISLGLLVDNSLSTSLLIGAFAGFAMYSAYDMTNLSYVKGYPVIITVIDIAWGTTQGIFSGIYVFFLTRYFSS